MESGMQSEAEIVQTLESWLLAASLPADGRIPSERALAAQFGVNRAEMRKALDQLEANGRVTRHVGRGTFLTSGAREIDPGIHVIARHVSPPEAMQARLTVEPEIAMLAAMHATTSQIDEMRRLTVATRAGKSWSEYEGHDWSFHNLLAESCGNRLLLEIERLVNGVRRLVVWGHLSRVGEGPPADYHSFPEHEAIVAAVERRDRRAARQAMEAHLRSTLAFLQDDGV